MCLHPSDAPPIPEQTVRVANAAFPKGNLYMKMRDAFDTCFKDEQFTDLFPSRGKPALTPWRLALVTVFQFVEGLSDSQTAEAVRARIDWKYALSLDLGDKGFEGLLTQFKERNLLKIRGEATNRLAVFVAADCRACGLRPDCTRSKSVGRSLYLHPKKEHEALHATRQNQKTPEFRAQYAIRAGIEGTLSQGIRAFDLRQSRYVGQAKSHLQNLMIATATNFRRVFEWLEHMPLARTRQSPFARLKSIPISV